MGMFDYIECEVDLPDEYQSDDGFQTKDLECALFSYIITKEGRLVLKIGSYLNEKRTFKLHDLNWHGHLNFYDIDKNNKWHEYEAKFTDGQLVSIELLYYDKSL